MASWSFCTEAVISSLTCSKLVVGSPYCPNVVIWLFTTPGPFSTSLLQLLHSGTSITAAIHRFWNIFPLGKSVGDFSGLLLLGPKLSCSIEVVMTSRYQFSLSIPNGGVVHPAVSTSATTGGAVWVVASVKPVSSPPGSLLSGSNTQLKRLIWGHWFVASEWTTPKPWRTSQLVNVTCSLTTSLNSTTPPAKGWKSWLSSRLCFSAQYCSPLV